MSEIDRSEALIAESRAIERRSRERREVGEKTACLSCGYLVSHVLPDRMGCTMGGYLRLRRCLRCGAKYTTEESPKELIEPGNLPKSA